MQGIFLVRMEYISHSEISKPGQRKIKMYTETYLARTVLDDDITVLADGTSLLRDGLGSTSIGLMLEGVLRIRHA